MPADPRRVKELFAAALDLPGPEARQAFLDRECGGDAELRRRVGLLLDAHDQPLTALERPLAGIAPADPEGTGAYEPAETLVGTVLAGKYKLLQAIGEGGMGSVFMADQLEPVKRRVAVKLIRESRDTPQVLARFEAERQALALMDHPNIARVLDAGETPPAYAGGSPRPYFVMELVKGVPLTRFCDEHRLSIPERLRLLMQVCSAVQHAHQKGIIHRDLKPSNILVESHDGRPLPKVIDFGLAKATSGLQLTENTLFTALGTVAGTPLYMAPEQATFNALDIDTRADIYALGVVLYELLTGTTPVERERLKKVAFDEVLRAVRESEPPTPSKRLSSSASRPTVAANRQMEPAQLGRFLRGDLDWVVMKALAKERERRYETASSFAKDIERFLGHEPVSAGPPTVAYKLRKFVRRNRGPVLAATLVLAALLAGMAGTTWGLVRAEQARQDEARQRAAAEANEVRAVAAAEEANQAKEQAVKAQQAEAARAEGEKQAREQAQKRLKQLEKSTETLASIFRNLDPTTDLAGRSLRVLLGERLSDAVRQLEDGEAFGDPLAVARLQDLLGWSLLALGHYDQAETLLTKALDTRRKLLEKDDPDTLVSIDALARFYDNRGDYPRAEELYKEAVAGRRKKLGDDDTLTLSSMNNLAQVYEHLGRPEEAEQCFQAALKGWRRHLGEKGGMFICMGNLGHMYSGQRRFREAEPLLKDAVEGARKEVGSDHPDTLTFVGFLGTFYRLRGQYKEAEPLLRKALEGHLVKLGPKSPRTLTDMDGLGSLCQDLGRDPEAEDLYKRALEGRREALGADHPDTLQTMNNLAVTHRRLRHYAEAEALYKQVLEAMSRKFGPNSRGALTVRHNLGLVYGDQGKYPAAVTSFKAVLKALDELGTHKDLRLAATKNLGVLYERWNRPDDARPLFEEAVEGMSTVLGASHPETLTVMLQLGSLYWRMKKLDKAIPLLEKTARLSTANKDLGPDHPTTLVTRAFLGASYCDAGRPDDGIRCLEDVLARARKRSIPLPPDVSVGVPRTLLEAYDRTGQFAKSEPLYREFLGQAAKQFGADDMRTASSMAQLGMNLLRQKKYADAERTLRDCLAVREKMQREEWTTFGTRSMLGEALLGQKKYADAEPLLVQGYEGMKQREAKIPPPGKARLTEALERLVRLYEATDQKGKADEWRRKLDAAKAAPQAATKP